MDIKGFDSDKYIKLQSKEIKERINSFGGKLYLEFGGKLFDDYHASRVLPGFKPDIKIKMLSALRDEMEIIIVVNSSDIEKNKLREDLDITYDLDVLRLIDSFREYKLRVSSVVITRFNDQPAVLNFKKRLENLGICVYKHYNIDGYPHNLKKVISADGLGKNEYIKTTSSLIVLTAPGPGSGKMATCLSQMYQDNLRGIKSGYAKFETFPIWNLPLNHPVNLAYESATADLNDVNMIDPFHLEAYDTTAVNYNRDIEVFPVLKSIFESIMGKCDYKSPTDMGVNMAGYCITDNDIVEKSAKQEIIRRYYSALVDRKKGLSSSEEIFRLELLMEKAGVSDSDRPVIKAAENKAQETGAEAFAIKISKDNIVVGKTSELMSPACAAILNALKEISGIDDHIHLIDPKVIEPIQKLKSNNLHSDSPRLHVSEMLIALAISAVSDTSASKAFDNLAELKGCEAHSTVILSSAETQILKKLGINTTFEPKYETQRFFMK
ncbi:MAG: DUF1846 domain-containing protein [Clostridia bacterium]|nr:DUF1846 domain-containing protein [Clostridia bacterium]